MSLFTSIIIIGFYIPLEVFMDYNLVYMVDNISRSHQ